MLYREHRGGLDESMATVVEVADFGQLVRAIGRQARCWNQHVAANQVTIEPYGFDARIGWHTRIVLVDGAAVGFLNGPMERS